MSISETETRRSELLKQAEWYRVRTHRKQRAHYLASKFNARLHKSLGIPVVVATTLVGTAIFAAVGKDATTAAKLFTGSLSAVAAVLSGLQTFLKSAELAERHKAAAASYSSATRAFDVFKLSIPDSEMPRLMKDLGALVHQIDALEKTSPDVQDRFYDRAVREQKSDPEGILPVTAAAIHNERA